MKNHKYNFNRLNVWILLSVAFLLHSCGKWTIDPELIGTWKTDKHKITVRTKPKNMKFQFTSDSTFTKLTITSNKTVEGYIGSAVIENGKIRTNWLLPTWMTRVAYTIKCDLIGKIFNKDPLETKKIEFWIAPLKENMEAELRYTQGWSVFPMAFIVFSKEEN